MKPVSSRTDSSKFYVMANGKNRSFRGGILKIW